MSAASSGSFDLKSAYFKSVVPMPPEMVRAFNHAVPLARRHGVAFRQGQVHVHAYRGQDYEPFGVTLHRERPVLVFMNASKELYEIGWVEILVHEFQHCVDAADSQMGLMEREDRAYAFQARAMADAEWWRAVSLVRRAMPVTR